MPEMCGNRSSLCVNQSNQRRRRKEEGRRKKEEVCRFSFSVSLQAQAIAPVLVLGIFAFSKRMALRHVTRMYLPLQQRQVVLPWPRNC
eukprot:scaffold1272_cov250-Pinguiococcus_pyrenoidosus.AAC.23